MNQTRFRKSLRAAGLFVVLIGVSGCASMPAPVAQTPAKRARPQRDPQALEEIRSEMVSLKERREAAAAKAASAKPTQLLSGGEARAEIAKQMPVPASAVPHEAPPETATEAPAPAVEPGMQLKKLSDLAQSKVKLSAASETPLIFDIPVTYNERVRTWIRYFQTTGRHSFRYWLERSSRYLPLISYELTRAGLPLDLVYVPMIESGFTPGAVSHAGAKGMWQFIVPTGRRYGLKIDWWIDERRDFHKSTLAAIGYIRDLYDQFHSWYLVAASYNMGENGVRRLIKKHGTYNFWELADRGALPRETTDYVPKIIAAMLISKAPALYGFRDLNYQMPLSYEMTTVPGGTDLYNLANFLGVSEKYLKDLNPELIKGFIPRDVRAHSIRVPKGSTLMVGQYIQTLSARN